MYRNSQSLMITANVITKIGNVIQQWEDVTVFYPVFPVGDFHRLFDMVVDRVSEVMFPLNELVQ